MLESEPQRGPGRLGLVLDRQRGRLQGPDDAAQADCDPAAHECLRASRPGECQTGSAEIYLFFIINKGYFWLACPSTAILILSTSCLILSYSRNTLKLFSSPTCLVLACQAAAHGTPMGLGDRVVKCHPMVPTASLTIRVIYSRNVILKILVLFFKLNFSCTVQQLSLSVSI